MKKKKKKDSNGIFIFPALILIFLAIVFHLLGDRIFYDLETSRFSSQNLTSDTPNVADLLWMVFKNLFLIYLRDYFLPVCLFLLPGTYFLAKGLSGDKEFTIFTSINNTIKERYFIVLLFITTFLIVLICHFLVLGHPVPVGDEFCYIFQSDLIASGKLYSVSPPCPDAFRTWSIINDGKWYSKITIGWPLMLAMGRLIGMDFIVNPLCAALSIVVLYLLGKMLLDINGAVLSVFFAILSPLFFLQGGTYFPHNATVLLILTFIYGLFKIEHNKSWFYPLLAGFCAGFLIHIRPGDGFIVFAGGLPVMLYLLIKSDNKKRIILMLIPVFLLFLIGLGLLLEINKIQNGAPFLFGYQKYDPEDKWGFDTSGHTPLKGLWNTVYSFMRNDFWTVPFIALFAVLSFFRKEIRLILLFIPYVFFIVSYFGFYSMGAFEIGSRYYLTTFILALIPASGGVLWLKERWKNSIYTGSEMMIPAVIISIVLFMNFGVFTVLFPKVNIDYGKRCNLGKWISDPPEISDSGPAIIFLRDHADKANMFFTRNLWQYEKQKNIVVFYLTPEENRKLLENFPQRKAYTIVYDRESNRFNIMSGVDTEETGENYFLAGANYIEIDKDKAIKAFNRSLELKPQNPDALNMLGLCYDTKKEYEKSLETYKTLSGFPDYRATAIYQIGITLGEMGNKDEAVKVFETLISADIDKGLSVKALNWIKYYKNK